MVRWVNHQRGFKMLFEAQQITKGLKSLESCIALKIVFNLLFLNYILRLVFFLGTITMGNHEAKMLMS